MSSPTMQDRANDIKKILKRNGVTNDYNQVTNFYENEFNPKLVQELIDRGCKVTIERHGQYYDYKVEI